ncbi:hypothetical protein [Hymenobacter weizhouensis]|uniref:hypothetical protein n=1 Tax=Hymenobacter sp. YIM 151500-1 TaxID=2987689 RepID=UPI0022272ECC|nr:hypothetical protein [Hymenobacter sp. YIM 151500-1]UYZ61616.1 hypothetical protein OIS53_11430 [Hymenobacter sp. YIM 151500-1]
MKRADYFTFLFTAFLWSGYTLFAFSTWHDDQQLETAPVALAFVQKVRKEHHKNSVKYEALVVFNAKKSLSHRTNIRIELDEYTYQRTAINDTLPVRYLPHKPQTAAYISSPASVALPLVTLICTVLFIGNALWSSKSRDLLKSNHAWHWVLHGGTAVFGLGAICYGLTCCADWSAKDGLLSPYLRGHHVVGRVIDASPAGSETRVLVAFRPVNEPPPSSPRYRWMAVPKTYWHTFQQTLFLGWRPPVDVWYPLQEQENAQLLLQLNPNGVGQDGTTYGLIALVGIVVLLSQVKQLERLRQKAE